MKRKEKTAKKFLYSICSDMTADAFVSCCAPSPLPSAEKIPSVNSDIETTVSVASVMDIPSDIFVSSNDVTPLPYEWKKEKLYSCFLTVGNARRRRYAPKRQYFPCSSTPRVHSFSNYTRGILRL